MKKILLAIFILHAALSSYSNIRLPKIFGDNMVLQRDKPIPVWGWAEPNEKITIQFNRQNKNIIADQNGKWMVKLNPEKAGGPYTLVATGTNTITFSNVLVGEVWICSGQSNMEMPIAGWGKINNYEQEIANANYPQIRHIKVPNKVSGTPQEDIEPREWKIANPQNAGEFTAVGYFFARALYDSLKVPVGLINTSWGGTMVETWTSREAFGQSDEFKDMITNMPTANLDSVGKVRAEAMIKKIEATQGPIVSKEVAMTWSAANADASNWKQMQLPALWESKGMEGVDGIVWFRKMFTVSAENAGKEATLELAMIDDNDITYVNGVKVGTTNAYNLKRRYTIPAGVLKEGINSIAIRVEDTGGGGGIYGEAADMKMTIANQQQSIAGDWYYRVETILQAASGIGPNDYPTLLYNAMVHPIVPYAMRGVLWYQGESNAGRAYQYRKAFPLLIKDWRKQWGGSDFPFYFVQLASYGADKGNSKKGSSWAELREAQTLTLSLPNTGMAVTTDIGDAKDIHPKNKQDVGKRLAAIALNKVYGKKVVSSGPVYQSMKTAGNTVSLSFSNTGSGLIAKGGGKLSGFEVAGEDKIFHPAEAVIRGGTVVVSSPSVPKPVAVRFGWADDAAMDNLFNKEGLPAVPFRTDSWKGITETAKFQIQ